MSRQFLQTLLIVSVATSLTGSITSVTVVAQDEKRTVKPRDVKHPGSECIAVDKTFANDVWAKVGERTCLKCHNPDGDASDSEFLLRDTARDITPGALRENWKAFLRMAGKMSGGKSLLLQRVTGGLDHGGGEVLTKDSTGYRILERFVRLTASRRRLRSKATGGTGRTVNDADASGLPLNEEDFFDGVTMIPPRSLLRRVTLALGGRLPTTEENAAVEQRGLEAVESILDQLMEQDAFYERLKEGFNDIFLLRGHNNLPSVGGYFPIETKLWYQHIDLSHVGDKKAQGRMRGQMSRDYREAGLRAPYELIAHIVRGNRPFTQIVTADYIMVSPYTARGYGIFEQVRDRFHNPDDPFEYIPAKLPSLTHRDRKRKSHLDQKTPTGFYPHAGLLTTFEYILRYPTTETNRNRLRARMYLDHFLGIDIMQLAPQVNDAAAITAKYEIPTMQATDCVVCHKVVDPIAGLFQDYYATGGGTYKPREEGWFTDMFPPGAYGENLPDEQRWRALQWLGERTAKAPRFAVAMVQHVYYILFGRKTLLPPEDIDDPLFAARRLIEATARKFAESDFNLKVVFKTLVMSPFYRADGLAAAIDNPERRAELDDVGLIHLLTPEQLERKLIAIFGRNDGAPRDAFHVLYGGIDSKEVTQRLTDPSGAMGALQRAMSSAAACRNVAADFALPREQRRLFPDIEPDVLPGAGRESDRQIRRTIAHLHKLILGRFDEADDPEVERTFELLYE